MKILVCVKQVPDTTEIKIDPVKNTLIREGVPSIVNTFDSYALELAARIKDKAPDTEIIVLSMGPEQAKTALRTCLAYGADKAYLVSDRVFGGSDTYATSYILSRAIQALEKKEGSFGLILCGKQAIDGDTAQTGPELAEHLGVPQVTYAVDISIQDEKATVRREIETGTQIVESSLPCLVTVTKTPFEPRYASFKAKQAAKKAEVPVLSKDDMDLELARCGLSGSPTKVKRTFVNTAKKSGIYFRDETPQVSAQKLVQLLSEADVI